jgi:hypothetical protein
VSRIPGTYHNRGNVLFVLPSIPDDAPAHAKNALALRNRCATEGRCPACGVVPDLERDGDGILHLVFRHEDDCPVLRDDEAAA